VEGGVAQDGSSLVLREDFLSFMYGGSYMAKWRSRLARIRHNHTLSIYIVKNPTEYKLRRAAGLLSAELYAEGTVETDDSDLLKHIATINLCEARITDNTLRNGMLAGLPMETTFDVTPLDVAKTQTFLFASANNASDWVSTLQQQSG
jgi:hypothetical protein